jgi:cobalt-zinc-cadmium efflux system outer membrane protein
MKRPYLFIIFAFMMGCSAYHPKPISPVQTASSFENRTLDDANLKEFLVKNLHREIESWPPNLWDFQTLTLVAFYYHPDLDVARAKWGVTQAGVITAGQRPNPSIGFLPQYNVNAARGVAPWILGFSFDIPIETAGKRGYRITQAEHLSEAARLNIATVAWQIRSCLRASLLNLYAADQSEVLLKRQLAIQEDLVELMERRLAVGEASQPDVTLTRLSLDQIRLSLSESRKQSAQARSQTANALGLATEAIKRIEISFSFLEKLPQKFLPEDLRRQALLNRPDILSSLAAYAANESGLQLQIAKQYPDLRLGPSYEFDQGENKWGIGVSLTLPILNRNQGPIAEAEAHRKEAAALFMSLQAQVIGEIERALAGYEGAIRKLEEADSLVSDKERQLHSAQAMFNAGEADRLTFLGAQLEYLSSKLSRLEALVQAQRSLGLLEDALQRPLDPSGSFLAVPEKSPRPDKER